MLPPDLIVQSDILAQQIVPCLRFVGVSRQFAQLHWEFPDEFHPAFRLRGLACSLNIQACGGYDE
jgi:hypothetical protein